MSPDLRERTFGKLTVARVASEVWATPVLWLTFCTCGTQMIVPEKDLLSGEVDVCDECKL